MNTYYPVKKKMVHCHYKFEFYLSWNNQNIPRIFQEILLDIQSNFIAPYIAYITFSTLC